MCYTCGCRMPYEDHGHPRNIVEQALVEAGKTKEIKNAGRVKAKENMLELIGEQERRGELEEPARHLRGGGYEEGLSGSDPWMNGP